MSNETKLTLAKSVQDSILDMARHMDLEDNDKGILVVCDDDGYTARENAAVELAVKVISALQHTTCTSVILPHLIQPMFKIA